MNNVASLRIRAANRGEVNSEGEYVLYWLNAFRRSTSNFSLQRALEWARDFDKPLVVFEALRCGYRWANERLHGFVIQGMLDNERHLAHRTESNVGELRRFALARVAHDVTVELRPTRAPAALPALRNDS